MFASLAIVKFICEKEAVTIPFSILTSNSGNAPSTPALVLQILSFSETKTRESHHHHRLR
jgi:hypothetical protein